MSKYLKEELCTRKFTTKEFPITLLVSLKIYENVKTVKAVTVQQSFSELKLQSLIHIKHMKRIYIACVRHFRTSFKLFITVVSLLHCIMPQKFEPDYSHQVIKTSLLLRMF